MNTGLSLYEIEDTLSALINSEDLAEGEDHLAILEEIGQASAIARVKRDCVVRFLRSAEAAALAKQVEAKRLEAEAAVLMAKVAAVKARCATIIQAFGTVPKKGQPFLQGDIFTMTLKQNPESVHVSDEAAVPLAYKRATVQIDAAGWAEIVEEYPALGASCSWTYDILKTAVKKAIKEEGLEVPGATIKDGEKVLKVK